MDERLGKPLTTTVGQPRINPKELRPQIEEPAPPTPEKKKKGKGAEVEPNISAAIAYDATETFIKFSAKLLGVSDQFIADLFMRAVVPAMLFLYELMDVEPSRPLTQA